MTTTSESLMQSGSVVALNPALIIVHYWPESMSSMCDSPLERDSTRDVLVSSPETLIPLRLASYAKGKPT